MLNKENLQDERTSKKCPIIEMFFSGDLYEYEGIYSSSEYEEIKKIWKITE
ncbi:TPA: hypothetical protein N2D99_002397 [Clostridium botulinum]|nr:hypothetical protein [Clostridium botulinum]